MYTRVHTPNPQDIHDFPHHACFQPFPEWVPDCDSIPAVSRYGAAVMRP